MNWIFDHLQALFVIAIVIVALLQKLKGRSSGESDEASPMNPAEAERTRRLQEEIRRKIMERRGLAPERPAESPAPAFPFPPPMIEEVRPVVVEPPRGQAMQTSAAAESENLERQRRLLDRLREYQAKRQAQDGGQPARAGGEKATAMPALSPTNPWLAELREPAGVRRAVVLREILGPPVGLR